MARTPKGGWGTRHQEIAKKNGYESWEAWIEEIEKEREDRKIYPVEICGGIGRTKQSPCKGSPVRYGRCQWHGAKVTRKPTTGQRSLSNNNYIPDSLVDDFSRFLQDPEYQSLRKEIAVMKVREKELLARLESTESAQGWKALESLSNSLVSAVVAQDNEKIVQISNQIHEIATDGVRRDETWKDLERITNHVRRLKESESKIKRNEDMVLDKDRAILLILWIMQLIRTKVNDPKAITEIGLEVRRRLGAPDLVDASTDILDAEPGAEPKGATPDSPTL